MKKIFHVVIDADEEAMPSEEEVREALDEIVLSSHPPHSSQLPSVSVHGVMMNAEEGAWVTMIDHEEDFQFGYIDPPNHMVLLGPDAHIAAQQMWPGTGTVQYTIKRGQPESA